ncbi:STAS/SEC14 domain-containing protein [Zunongwangia sp. F260]|uniref:STAS/SEC14 domain-containing protein n=1 Tax=Autumnicola lenta TaxID=3075593 RepID=A0ABU3CHK8_9FLAO|nr:STAS/SEC14 domain-containing protein [Zunongwangia sp. F260]MDT0645776.1 STAS/SEC14 domain-containing protein [Zunongwangia sp. F260]
MVSTFEFAENVIGVTINSDIDDELMKNLVSMVSERMEEHDKVSLFCELKAGNELSFTAFLRNLGFNVSHRGEFYKIAVVTDESWIKNAFEFKDLIAAADITIYDNENRLEALSWITQ